MSSKMIVFDFDGTLADSLSVLLDIYNKDFAPKWNLRPVDLNEWQRLRQMSFAQGMRSVGVKPYQLASMLPEGRRLVKARAHDIKLFPGATDLLKFLAGRGHHLYALSSNDQAVIREVLEAEGITNQIQVLKSPRLFGKANSLRRLLRQTATPASSAVMVGDEVRDMTAAKKAGMQSVAVAWGFQPEVTLAAHSPTAIVHTFAELRAILSKTR